MSTKITGYGTPATVVTGSTRTGGVERVAGARLGRLDR